MESSIIATISIVRRWNKSSWILTRELKKSSIIYQKIPCCTSLEIMESANLALMETIMMKPLNILSSSCTQTQGSLEFHIKLVHRSTPFDILLQRLLLLSISRLLSATKALCILKLPSTQRQWVIKPLISTCSPSSKPIWFKSRHSMRRNKKAFNLLTWRMSWHLKS